MQHGSEISYSKISLRLWDLKLSSHETRETQESPTECINPASFHDRTRCNCPKGTHQLIPAAAASRATVNGPLHLWYLGNVFFLILSTEESKCCSKFRSFTLPHSCDHSNNDSKSKWVVDGGILHQNRAPLWLIWFQSTAIQNKLLPLISWNLNDFDFFSSIPELERLGFNLFRTCG